MNKLAMTILVIGFALLALYSGIFIYASVQFDIHCAGHLERAAKANSIALATQELDTAIAYIEMEHLTTGYTSILYQTPDEDLGFWYTNIMASHTLLKRLADDSSALETSNVLMKVHESLTNSGGGVRHPMGISIYPHNVAFAILLTIALLVLTTGTVWVGIDIDY
jgi:hypothetical protein